MNLKTGNFYKFCSTDTKIVRLNNIYGSQIVLNERNYVKYEVYLYKIISYQYKIIILISNDFETRKYILPLII